MHLSNATIAGSCFARMKRVESLHIRNSPSLYHFCTYFDHNYLTRGLALHASLMRFCTSPFTLWILCFDEETQRILSLLDLPNTRLISQREFESDDPALENARKERSAVEYFWTCTPSLILYLLKHRPEIQLITYLDADLYFFSEPEPIYDEMGAESILILEHRYAPEYMHMAETSGIYNVSLLSFRRDESALICLRWWHERCLEWCYARVEDDKFGDQKYLDDWPTRFKDVAVLQHKGAGLAPWNITNYSITRQGDHVWVDERPLIFYHFHGLAQYSRRVYRASHIAYHITPRQKRWIYEPYLQTLDATASIITQADPEFSFGLSERAELRDMFDGRLDVLGTTRYLPVIRKVYATVQKWYRAFRYHQRIQREDY